MRLTLLALIAAGIYEYDKKQVKAGKKSMFEDLGQFVGGLKDKFYNVASSAKKSYEVSTKKTGSGNY